MRSTMIALVLVSLALSIGSVAAKEELADASQEWSVSSRRLTAYQGCSKNGVACTTDNGNGTSTTCVNTPSGYSHCVTHPNGEKATGGRKLKDISQEPISEEWTSVLEGLSTSSRKLTAYVYTGCSANDISCTVDNGNGTSTVCVNTPSGVRTCDTYPNAESYTGGRKLKDVSQNGNKQVGK